MRMKFVIIITMVVVFSSGCRGRVDAEQYDKPSEEATAFIIPTATMPPTPTTAPTATNTTVPPTAIPAPTQIIIPTDQSGVVVNTGIDEGPGIYLSEEMGEPGETLMVEGRGFDPNVAITFHWSKVDGPLGARFTEVTSNENGEFSLNVTVPIAANWPGGSAQTGDFIQLRAKQSDWADTEYFWANFRYVERFSPGASLVLLYENDVYDYSVALPNGWKWEWTEDDVSNVRFSGPDGGSGFSRVVTGAASAVIAQVMSLEAPNQAFTSATGTLGSITATRVTAANGLVVLFAEKGGFTYAISFKDSAGNAYNSIINSFRFR